ncbi:MAG: hypothetical protein HGA53_03165, partial [Anaerolineaceae bacterium]|nr:hypothetical protein [Anaerolineaceae bacterium]
MTTSRAALQVFTSRSSKNSIIAFRILIAFILIASFFLNPGGNSALARPETAPTADITNTLPGEGLVGEPVNFNVTISNGGTTGFGPFIDLVFPLTGADGNDGLDFGNATYLGAALTKVINIFPPAVLPATDGCLAHPYAKASTGLPVQVCGKPGDKLVTILMPFGSFVPGQPDVTVNISATMSNLADVGTALTVQTRGGYMYGNDEYDNPQTDPSMVGGFTSSSIKPTLMTLTKTYVGPEDETATGPNYPRQYLITANIANGQTLTDFDLTDILPNNLQFVQLDSTSIRGTSTATTSIDTPSTATPGGTLTRRFASVTGTTAANDAEMLYTFYVPLKNSVLSDVLPPATGAFQPSSDDAKASGTWAPIDVRDTPSVVTSDLNPIDHTLIDKSIAVQKSVSPSTGIKPQTILTYTFSVQISDFFAFENLVATDTFSDGQRWFTDATHTPSFSVNGNQYTIPATNFSLTNYSVDTSMIGDTPLNLDPTNSTDGSTTVTFRLSDEIKALQPNGWMVGGCVPVAPDRLSGGTGAGVDPNCSTYNDGATTATITFYTQIQDEFSDNYNDDTNTRYVDQGDSVGNTVSVSGNLLNVTNLIPNGNSMADGSAAGVSIERGMLEKSVYAKNGVICSPTCGMLRVGPGDTVTYRIKYMLPTSDLEAFKIDDFLPLPIFRATEMTTFVDTISAAAPPAGTVKFGPTDTFRTYSTIIPTVSNTPS